MPSRSRKKGSAHVGRKGSKKKNHSQLVGRGRSGKDPALKPVNRIGPDIIDDCSGTCCSCDEPLEALSWREDEWRLLPCCGRSICKLCGDFVLSSPSYSSQDCISDHVCCPGCGKVPPESSNEIVKQLTVLAYSGNVVSQYQLARHFEGNGETAFALKWFERAADRGFVLAQVALGDFHRLSLMGEEKASKDKDHVEGGKTPGTDAMDRSYSTAKTFYETSLRQGTGHAAAQHGLATLYRDGFGVAFQDDDLAMRLMRDSALQDYPPALLDFSNMLINRDDIHQGRVYLRRASEFDVAGVFFAHRAKIAEAQYTYARTTLDIFVGDDRGDGLDVPMKDPRPMALYWARKGAKNGNDDAVRLVNQMEAEVHSKCANCGRSEEGNSEMMMCVQCRAVSYCNRECQRSHWKNCHKTDCFPRKA